LKDSKKKRSYFIIFQLLSKSIVVAFFGRKSEWEDNFLTIISDQIESHIWQKDLHMRRMTLWEQKVIRDECQWLKMEQTNLPMEDAQEILLIGKIHQSSISSTFYARIFANILAPKITKLKRSALRLFGKRILAKNERIKCWWNWHQIILTGP